MWHCASAATMSSSGQYRLGSVPARVTPEPRVRGPRQRRLALAQHVVVSAVGRVARRPNARGAGPDDRGLVGAQDAHGSPQEEASEEESPGVYRFRDEHGRVIYVGKAKSLRSRLSSYFQDIAALHPRTQQMVTTAASVEWTVVGTEVEALALEFSWIKEFDPRFNVKYRDDKSYPYLAVTLGEEFPRVQVMRGAKHPGTRYFGPYAHAWAIRETVDLLLRVFPVRTCSAGVFKRAAQTGRPCLLGYIDKCSAPCVGRISPDDHRAVAEDFCDFMAGQTARYVRRLEQQMRIAATNLEYELAARLRGQGVPGVRGGRASRACDRRAQRSTPGGPGAGAATGRRPGHQLARGATGCPGRGPGAPAGRQEGPCRDRAPQRRAGVDAAPHPPRRRPHHAQPGASRDPGGVGAPGGPPADRVLRHLDHAGDPSGRVDGCVRGRLATHL